MQVDSGDDLILVRTERLGIGQVWALPLSSVKTQVKPDEGIPFIPYEEKLFQRGLLLTPDELIRKGSLRLAGRGKLTFPDLKREYPLEPKESVLSHLEFLRYWGLPGGVLGGSALKALGTFLKSLKDSSLQSKILVVGPKRALGEIELRDEKGITILSPEELGGVPSGLLSLLLLIEADRTISLSARLFYWALKTNFLLCLGQFTGNEFIRQPQKREALSRLFHVSYYSAVWDYLLLDPSTPFSSLPNQLAESGIYFADFTISQGVAGTPLPIPPPEDRGAINYPWSVVHSSGSHSFFDEARLLLDYEESTAEFIPFKRYYPTYADMNPKQLSWYFFWRGELRKGQYLDTDLSYIFLHVYELINNISRKSHLENFLELKEIWLNYRDRFPKLDYYLVDWLADYVLLYDLPLSYLDIYKQALSFGFLRNPNLLLCEYLKGGISFIPPLLWEAFSSYKFLKSPFLRGKKELIEDIPPLMGLIDETMKSSTGKGIFSTFDPKYKIKISRFPFQGALLEEKSSSPIFLGEVTPFSQVPALRNFLAALITEWENQLRIRMKYPHLLHTLPFDKGWKRLIADFVSFQKAPLKRSISLDFRLVRDLIKVIEEERVIPPAPTSKKDTEQSGWESLISRLNEAQMAILQSLSSGESAEKILQIAKSFSIMPEVLLDSLNELALESIGDLVVDTLSSPPVLFPEVLDKIKEEVNINSNERK